MNIYKPKRFKVPLPQHTLFTSAASESEASCQCGMQQNKAKILCNIISAERTDNHISSSSLLDLPIYSCHIGDKAFTIAGMTKSLIAVLLLRHKQTIFPSELIHEDNASLLPALLFFSAFTHDLLCWFVLRL